MGAVQAERQATNTMCQGSAADLVKWAMLQLNAALESDPQLVGKAALVLQVRAGWRCGAHVCLPERVLIPPTHLLALIICAAHMHAALGNAWMHWIGQAVCKASACRRVEMCAQCMLPVPQVHDELVFEVVDEVLPYCAALVKRTMEGIEAQFGLRVPFPIKLAAGPSWGELADYRVPPK